MNAISGRRASRPLRGGGAGRTGPAPVTPAQLEKMKALLVRSMHEGAWGMVLRFESGGPDYPGDADAIALPRSISWAGMSPRISAASRRWIKNLNSSSGWRARRMSRSNILHLNYGQVNWPKMQHFIDRINQARAEGLDVTANEYPYTAITHPRQCPPGIQGAGGIRQGVERPGNPAAHQERPGFATLDAGAWHAQQVQRLRRRRKQQKRPIWKSRLRWPPHRRCSAMLPIW